MIKPSVYVWIIPNGVRTEVPEEVLKNGMVLWRAARIEGGSEYQLLFVSPELLVKGKFGGYDVGITDPPRPDLPF